MAAGSQPEVDAIQVEYWARVLHELSLVVERARQREEVRPDTDAAVVLQLLIGPLLVSTVLLHAEPDARLVDQLADAVARTFASRPGS